MNLANQSRIFTTALITIVLLTAKLYFDSAAKINNELNTYEKVTNVVQGIFELNMLTDEYISTQKERTIVQWRNRHASLTNLLLIIEKQSFENRSTIINRTRLNLSKVRTLFHKVIVLENIEGINIPSNNKNLINRITAQARLLTQQIVSDVNRMKVNSQIVLEQAKNRLTLLMKITLILIGVIFFTFMCWMKIKFLSPILKLNQHSQRLAQGNYHEKMLFSGKNEIAELSKSFNMMTQTISEKIEALTEKSDSLENSKKELERSLASIKSAELRYGNIFNSSYDCIISINDEGLIQTINPAGEKLFGYSEFELTGKNVTRIMPSPDKENHDSYIKNYKISGKPKIIGVGRTLEGLRKDGTLIPIALTVSKITIDGQVFFNGVIRDITEELAAKESLIEFNRQLMSTNKELESYAYSISHNLRSPLRAIDGYSMILLKDFAKSLDDEAQDYLSRIRSSTRKMGELFTDLLKMSRITQETLDVKPLNLSELANEEMGHLQSAHPDRVIEFLCAPDIDATGDQILIQAVLENLLNNAVKYTEKESTAIIQFDAYQNENKDKIYFIKDNGVGFNMAHKDKLFKAFQRLHKDKDFEGSGIGLATVQRIIERHNGKIWAESEPDKGATFYFTLKPRNENNG